MDRVSLKNRAKKLIKDNKLYIWKPLIMFTLITMAVTTLTSNIDSLCGLTKEETIEFFGVATTYKVGGPIASLGSMATSFISSLFYIGYAYYLLSFVRGKKMEMSDFFDFIKKNWIVSFVVSLFVGLIVGFSFVLLLIPGIIAAIGHTFYKEVCADNPKMQAWEIVKKSWNLTKGHKMDIFVLLLSFIGWNILAIFTFGILYIWLAPYMSITMSLAYEELKK